MKAQLLGLGTAALLMLAAGDANQLKKELAKLDGTWVVNELTYNGKDHKELTITFVFKAGEVTVKGDESVKKEYGKFKVTLDPGTSPKLMDISISDGTQKGAAIEGIYELKGEKNDELRICAKIFGKDRPTEFSSPDGGSIALLVLNRSTEK